MFHLLGDAERDRFVAGLTGILGPGDAFIVLGDARRAPGDVYGISPAEIRARFRPEDSWRVGFVSETTFERRHSRNPAYVAFVQRTPRFRREHAD